MRKLLAVPLLVGAAVAVGQVVARRASRGEDSDAEFRRVALLAGQEVKSRSEQFRAADVVVGLGGVTIDLTDARLADGGAVVRIRGAVGGVHVEVPSDWRVTGDLTGFGGMNLDTTPVDDLPDDAPALHLDARVIMGGVNVEGRH
ncbi:MAG: cell wall-active antibiotics response protein [Actinomycetota bacterium]|nr:cell wall-active antibiotics response protein [Actinomycetota bacterium]MDH5277560.1 cell wall-active antibiotics response protein [Actinomycetota bacterium]